MNEAQAQQLVRDAFRQLTLTNTVMGKADPALYAAIVRITEAIKQLPPAGDLMRERAWKRLQVQLLPSLDTYTKTLGKETLRSIKDELGNIEKFAQTYVERTLEVKGKTVSGQVVTLTSQQGLGGFSWGSTGDRNVRTVESPFNFTATVGGEQITVRSGNLAYRAMGQINVAGQDLSRILGIGINDQGEFFTAQREGSNLARFMLESVNKRVQIGILRGDATEDIVKDLITDSTVSRVNLGVTAKNLRSQAMTVARTAIADGNAKLQEAFWEQNDHWEWEDPETGEKHEGNLIAGWEYDAQLDGNICERCAPLDGKITTRKNELPQTPIHPRCRCRRLPLSASEMLLRKEEGEAPGSAIELFNEEQLRKKFGAKDGESTADFIRRIGGPRDAGQGLGPQRDWRVFKSTVKGPDGERWYRAARDLRLTKDGRSKGAADWLAEATPATQQAFFDSPVRAALFRRKIKDEKKTARQALAELLQGPTNNRQFIPLSRLKTELPSAERIDSPAQERRRRRSA